MFFKKKPEVENKKNLNGVHLTEKDLSSMSKDARKKVEGLMSYVTNNSYTLEDYMMNRAALIRELKLKSTILMVCAVLTIISLIFASSQTDAAYKNYNSDRYLAIDSIGNIVSMAGEPSKSYEEATAIDFANSASVQILTMSFSRLKDEYFEDKNLFSEEGLKAYYRELVDKNIIKQVRELRENVSVIPLQPFVITNRPIIGGNRVYILRGYYLASFSGKKVRNSNILITLAVRSAKESRNRHGMVIDKIKIQEYR